MLLYKHNHDFQQHTALIGCASRHLRKEAGLRWLRAAGRTGNAIWCYIRTPGAAGRLVHRTARARWCRDATRLHSLIRPNSFVLKQKFRMVHYYTRRRACLPHPGHGCCRRPCCSCRTICCAPAGQHLALHQHNPVAGGQLPTPRNPGKAMNAACLSCLAWRAV